MYNSSNAVCLQKPSNGRHVSVCKSVAVITDSFTTPAVFSPLGLRHGHVLLSRFTQSPVSVLLLSIYVETGGFFNCYYIRAPEVRVLAVIPNWLLHCAGCKSLWRRQHAVQHNIYYGMYVGV